VSVSVQLPTAGARQHARRQVVLGIDGAAARCSEALADALIVCGTPDECIPAIPNVAGRPVIARLRIAGIFPVKSA
jgi:hypothetical protein